MVLPRVLTALVLAPVFLWVLYLGNVPFLAFMFILIVLALWEFHRVAEEGGYATQGSVGIAAGAGVALSMVFPGVRPTVPFVSQAPAFAVMLALLLMILREMARKDKGLSMLRLAMSFTGILLIVWPLGYLALLRELRGTNGTLMNGGFLAAVFLVVLIWTQDTAAYFVGISIGKHRLAPAISPKKSWEGAVGGLVAGVLLSLALRELFMKDLFGRGEILVLASVLGALAQVSDLTESLIKRCFGVKDSSALLPGHGGVLDRFDSFLLTAPFLYFYMISLGKVG
ncbi:MAG: phosphatidate cytidylyltransferase [Elusimicrobia bacterium]|nr:phosphatidate cytidylyltransferase [Elusimicrobiota bacterium]